jgi:hypothetical protein
MQNNNMTTQLVAWLQLNYQMSWLRGYNFYFIFRKSWADTLPRDELSWLYIMVFLYSCIHSENHYAPLQCTAHHNMHWAFLQFVTIRWRQKKAYSHVLGAYVHD